MLLIASLLRCIGPAVRHRHEKVGADPVISTSPRKRSVGRYGEAGVHTRIAAVRRHRRRRDPDEPRGVLSGTVSVPCRYIHSPFSIMRLDDFENTVRLATAFARRCTDVL